MSEAVFAAVAAVVCNRCGQPATREGARPDQTCLLGEGEARCYGTLYLAWTLPDGQGGFVELISVEHFYESKNLKLKVTQHYDRAGNCGHVFWALYGIAGGAPPYLHLIATGGPQGAPAEGRLDWDMFQPPVRRHQAAGVRVVNNMTETPEATAARVMARAMSDETIADGVFQTMIAQAIRQHTGEPPPGADVQRQVDWLLARIMHDARAVMELTRGREEAGVIPGKASNIVGNVLAAGDELRRWTKGEPTAYAAACAEADRELREERASREQRVTRKRRPAEDAPVDLFAGHDNTAELAAAAQTEEASRS